MSLLSIGRAWDEAKAALASNRKLVVPVALGLVLLPAVIVSMVEPRVAPGEQPPPGAWMLIGLLMVIVMLVGELAIVLLISGWRGSVGEAIGKAARRTPTFILAALCLVVPIVLVFSVLLAFAGLGTSASGQIDWTNVGMAGWLVVLACMFLLLYLSIRLLPLVAVVACEEISALPALRRSFSLTAGHFWRLLSFLLLVGIAFLIVAATVGAVIGGIVTLVLGPPEPWTLSLLLIALAGGLVQAGFVMVYIAMMTRIYAQLTAGETSVPDVSREG